MVVVGDEIGRVGTRVVRVDKRAERANLDEHDEVGTAEVHTEPQWHAEDYTEPCRRRCMDFFFGQWN